ncbi:MAG TPA: CAAX prenyl protease-related protein [Tepidisphaeraceae bacterium]|jgi:hypothetical protein
MRVRSDLAYILPMAAFVGITWLGTQFKDHYPLTYVVKTIFAGVLLVLFWKAYTRIRWTHWHWGLIVGVLGVVQWIGMEKLLMTQSWLSWTRMIGDIRAETFRPYEYFSSAGSMWAFILFRWAGSFLVVPVMEELFWRDYAWRTIASPNDFKLQGVGEYDTGGFWIVPLIFATVHVQWLTAIVWALMIGLLLLKTRSLGACIIAHGVTNFLLGGYVLFAHYVLKWDEWYFW